MEEEKLTRLNRELALAIMFWKQIRMTNKIPALAGGRWVTEESFDAALYSLDLTRHAGLSVDEFLSVLSEFPTLTFTVKELEKWEPDSPSKSFNPFINRNNGHANGKHA